MPGEPDDYQCGATSHPNCPRGLPADLCATVGSASYRSVLAVDNRRRATGYQPSADNLSNATFWLGMPTRNPDAGGNSLGETKSEAEAGKHVTNIATITSMDKKRGLIKYVLLDLGQCNLV
jgi:hypothetical protein